MRDGKNAQYIPALRASTKNGLWASKVDPLIAPAAVA
jgi:hypothetical protein